jgi:hypothetical protein
MVGAALLDAERLTGQPLLEAMRNLLMPLAGLASIGLPLGLRAAGVLPRSALAVAGTTAWGLSTDHPGSASRLPQLAHQYR